MYHSIESMPKSSVMRGMYVPPSRFDFQMKMLKYFGFKGLSISPLLAKLFLINLAVDNELLLSPCIQTESIAQGICLPLRQFIA